MGQRSRTESLTTDLSTIRGSFVIGRHTAFAYKSKAAGPRSKTGGAMRRNAARWRVVFILVVQPSGTLREISFGLRASVYHTSYLGHDANWRQLEAIGRYSLSVLQPSCTHVARNRYLMNV
jgi:hypothetical protein